jgi:hypothetical protein
LQAWDQNPTTLKEKQMNTFETLEDQPTEVQMFGPFWGKYYAALNAGSNPVVPLLGLDVGAIPYGDFVRNSSGMFVYLPQLEVRDRLLAGEFVTRWGDPDEIDSKYSRAELERFAKYGASHGSSGITLNSELLCVPPGFMPTQDWWWYMADNYNASSRSYAAFMNMGNKFVSTPVYSDFDINEEETVRYLKVVPAANSIIPGAWGIHGGNVMGDESFQDNLARGCAAYMKSFGDGSKLMLATITEAKSTLKRLDREWNRQGDDEGRAAFMTRNPGYIVPPQ